MDINEKQLLFLKSYDFMKLGNAINTGNKQAVHMTVTRMLKNAKECELGVFDKWLTSIKQCMMGGGKSEALGLMTLVTQKRVQLLNQANNANPKGATDINEEA